MVRSILTILLLNNECSYQDRVLVAIFLVVFGSNLSLFFTWKKQTLVDGNIFRLKSGAFS